MLLQHSEPCQQKVQQLFQRFQVSTILIRTGDGIFEDTFPVESLDCTDLTQSSDGAFLLRTPAFGSVNTTVGYESPIKKTTGPDWRGKTIGDICMESHQKSSESGFESN